ncbi:helix-turn-helix transcriptional regulator [Kocuria oceani]|uniref:Helix-turn-helix transcriptional regulator n=1 Tax=Kocuria oceani TaxID=988827 RepID=A0ABV9TJU6_9MICC|nr:helix-turn-helix transcriptional regulator [Kocuria oceani]
MPRPAPDAQVSIPPDVPSAPVSRRAWGADETAHRRPAVRKLRFISHDPSEGVEVLERVYAARVRVSPGNPFSMHQALGAVERLSLERVRLSGAPAAALIDAPGTLRVARVLGGRLAFTDATSTAAGPSPFLFPVRSYTCRWDELDLLTLSLDLAAVEAHAAGLLDAEDFRLRFTAAEPVSPAMARYLTGSVTALGQHQLGNEQAMASPLVRAETFRALATAVLHAFPNSFLERSAVPEPERAAPAGVRRAVSFMEEHAAEDIGLGEIARAARMSPRGLQAAFRRELSTTPLAHLRTLRLEAVRAELLTTDPGAGATVAEVAGRWGFSHPGRFAAAYRERFGENPAATLRG